MKKLTVIILCIILWSSCGDDIINLSPLSELATTNFYETEVDFNAALIAAYDVLQEKNSIDFILSEIRSDNGTDMKVQYEKDFDNFTLSPTNELISRFWKITYKGIFRTNIILEKIPGANFAEGKKNLIIAQTKFLRAYFYFDLVRYFGDVPLVTKVLKLSESAEVKRSPVESIYQLIEADLKESAGGLPAVWTGVDIGRITKGASNALLAKVFLTRNRYAEAKTLLELVIGDTQAAYQLLPSFSNVFSVNNQNNKEIVFAVQYSNAVSDGNRFMNDFAPGSRVAEAAGVGSNYNFPTVDLIRAYEPGDTRKAVTLSEYVVNLTKPDTINTPYNRKFLSATQSMTDSGLDWPIIRFSDVILMYAEVLNELNDLSGAITQLNKIRERAFGNKLKNFTTSSIPNQEVFRIKVLNERRVELAFENHRWFDLLRTGKALEFMQVERRLADWKTGMIFISLNLNMKAYQALYPIPLDEIENSKGNLTQNEGYK